MPTVAPAVPDTAVLDRGAIDLVIGRFGVGPGELSAPEGVTVDAKGRILVADTGNHRIVRFDSTGAYLDQFGGFGHEENRFDRPTAVFAGNALAIWVLDRGNSRIVKFDLEGRPIGVVVDLESEALRARLGRVEPGGFDVDAGGRIVLTDLAGDRVLEFDPLGALLVVRGEFGRQPGRFADPSGVAVDPRGGAWIADAGNRRLQHLDALGGLTRADTLDSPWIRADRGLGLAVHAEGRLAVADPATGTLELRQGAYGIVTGRRRPADKKDAWASGVAFDRAGRVLVADARNHRVVRLVFVPRDVRGDRVSP